MWSNFSTCSSDEETINGTYCRNGLFKISGDEKVSQYPHVQAAVENKKMVISMDNCIILLEDENSPNCSFLSFKSKIDKFIISQTGNLIICTLSDGDIYGVLIKGQRGFNVSINAEDVRNEKTFNGIHRYGPDYYLTCTSGAVYRLGNIDESQLNIKSNDTFQDSETYTFEETMMANLELERLSQFQGCYDFKRSLFILRNGHNTFQDYILIAEAKSILYIWNNSELTKLCLPTFYNGIKNIYNLEHYILILTNSGQLFEICVETNLIFNVFEDSVTDLIEDLIVMENNDNCIEFLILTKPNKYDKRFMKLIEFTGFKCIYEVELPKDVWMVRQHKNSVNLYYLSGENYNEFGLPQEIEMKIISETDPDQRLKKLIQKGYLEEAEEFGKQMGLSLQPIYEAKAKKLLIIINCANEDDVQLINELFCKLMHTLKLIENKNFFLQIRTMEIPNRKITSQFLEEVLKHLNDEQFSEEVLEIKELQLRMETLNIIDPYECNLEWQKFLHHQNMLKMCTTYLKTDIMTACLIWKRHAASIIRHLDEENVIKILNLIPPKAELFDVIQWLQHFIPVVTQIYPKTMPYIVKWIIKKTRSLQYSNHWPEIGFEFSTDATAIFEHINFLFCDVGRQFESSMEKLRRLVLALQNLSTLKNDFNLILTLENYIKDSIDDTALSVLQRVHINSLQKLVKQFLYPIYMEKGTSPVNAIIKYIQFLLANRKGISYWLERAIVCIELLHNEEDKLSSALLILRAAPVPWPDTISPLMKLKNSTHPLAIEINTECELQILKIIKVKYDWPANSTDDNMKLVFRIIKMNRPEMMQDLKDIVNVIPEITTNAYFYCCYEYVKKGEIEKVLEFLHTIEEQKRMECYMMLINIFKRKLEETEDLEHSEYMVEFLKCILNEIKRDDHEEFLIFLDLKLLHNNFNINAKLQDLMDIRKKELFLNEGCKHIKTCLNNCFNVVDKAWHGICQLTAALKLEKVLGVIEMVKLLNSIHFTCAMSYNLLELDEVSNLSYQYYVDLAAILIIQEINIHIEGHEITDSLTYPLVYNLLIRALQHGKIEHVEITEFLQWVRIASNLYGVSAISDYYKNLNNLEENVKDNLKGKFITPVTSSKKRDSILVFNNVIDKTENAKQPISKPLPVVKCLSLCLVVISQVFKPMNSILKKIGALLKKTEIVCTDELKEKFFGSLEHLIKSKQYVSWYMIVQYILQLQKQDGNTVIICSTAISLQVKKWLHYLLGCKEPNFLDLFSMVICEPDSAACLEYLNNKIKTGHQRINFLMLSEMYYLHFQNWEKVSANRESRMKYFYYSELCKQDFTLKNKSNIEFVSISQIMKELGNKKLDVNLLKKLSIDFDWDYQQVLVTQVSSLLQLQEPNFEIKCDAFGKQELIMKTTVEEIQELCQPYIREITDTDLLASKLQNLMIKEINFYFYELYLCVLDILAYINAFPREMELWRNILLFLKHKMTTKRRKRASQMETDWWLKSQLEAGVLPKIAKYRIPFIPIIQEDLKVVLEGEVSVDNCVSWFPLIKLHAALQGIASQTEILEKQEHFCMSAVKNSIYERKQQNEETDDSDEWHLQPLNNAFLQAILRLIRSMVDTAKILFILYFVTHHAPNGADQVEAAFECYNFAIKHEKQLMANEKAKEIISKIKRKYPIFKTQHLLYLYGLVEDNLLQLVENPKELINALYNHDVVLKTSKPDINKLASEIAELHNLDFTTLQMSLLQNWMALTFPTEVSDLEDTFYEDLNATMPPVDPVNDNFVSRVHYILTSWDPEKAMDFLIRHIFPIDATINTGKQLQMFECFAKLNNEENLFYGDIVNQNHYIITKCVHYLKQLGYNYTAERFKQNDKLNILKKLWQNHANNTHALEVMSLICTGFNIYIPQIWNGILKQMVNLNMVKELESLVEVLSCKSILIPIEGLAKAWECVLRTPFKIANRTRSYDQENILHKNLVRIQSCPLVQKLNLVEIAQDCIRLDRYHMAAILIAFCKENQKDDIKMMVMKRKCGNLQKDIIDLQKAGILPKVTSYVLKFLNM